MTNRKIAWRLASLALLALPLYACAPAKAPEEHGESAEADYERGPHNGRLLRDGDLAVEVTIYEEGVEPQFRLFPFVKDKPVTPSSVLASMSLKRLGGDVDNFNFTPEADYLKGDATVAEPHSFDVTVRASLNGKTSRWAYQSYEGRTTIAAAQAEASGVKVEIAGPAAIEETVALSGRVELQPSGRADITACM